MKIMTAQPLRSIEIPIVRMKTDFFIPALHGIRVKVVCFQQDCATCHISHAIIDLLRQTFDEPLINRNGDVN